MLAKKFGSGFVLGKFMPLHEGHVHLFRFAETSCHRLTILVCTLPRDPIPGQLRYDWVRTMFPHANVVHHANEIPQEPGEHPDFWTIWRETIAAHCPGEEFDAVFASEDYGWKLAGILGAEYVPVDRLRHQVPISAIAIRSDPMRHFDYLPSVVRPYYVRRIALVGPESVGKSMLARRLAERFHTVFVDEYARSYLAEKVRSAGYRPDEFRREDIPNIARGQIASEESLAHRANRLLVCDTEILTTMFWSKTFFDWCPAWIEAEAGRRRYDLIILLSPEGAPHVQDGTRSMVDPGIRMKFFDAMRSALIAAGRRHVVVAGGFEERFARAVELAQGVLDEKMPAA